MLAGLSGSVLSSLGVARGVTGAEAARGSPRRSRRCRQYICDSEGASLARLFGGSSAESDSYAPALGDSVSDAPGPAPSDADADIDDLEYSLGSPDAR